MSEFVWTFPCYLLAGQYTADPVSGEPVIDEHLRFITPEAEPGGSPCPAIFTDEAGAEQFRDGSELSLELVALPTPAVLIRFLERARPRYSHVAVDLHRRAGEYRLVEIGELILELERVGDQGGPGSR